MKTLTLNHAVMDKVCEYTYVIEIENGEFNDSIKCYMNENGEFSDEFKDAYHFETLEEAQKAAKDENLPSRHQILSYSKEHDIFIESY